MGFIFDQKNGLLPMIGPGKAERILRRSGLFATIDSREIGTESRAALRLAVDEDKPAALFHDAIHSREDEAGAFGALGGKERLEEGGLGFAVHADARAASGA